LEDRTGTPPPPGAHEHRLESWKEIATHVKRDVTTVQRWEKREGMPVHRHLHHKRGSVYAFPSELDDWLKTRKLRLEIGEVLVSPTGPMEADAVPEQLRRIPWILILTGVSLLALLGTGAFLVWTPKNERPPKIRSLAVLPLKNLSGDPAQDYLADGMTESIIGRLSMIGGLRVISRTSAMQYKDAKLSVPEIAKALDVDALVEGSVIREGNRVRVHCQLIRTSTDEHFWSETYDRDLGDALTLESDVAQAITRRVEVTVSGEEQARLVAARPVAPEVYENYLKGEAALGDRHIDFEKSIGYFQAAIQQDPSFAPAYLGLAEAYGNFSSVFIGGQPSEARIQELRAARKAIELDPSLAYAHQILASVYQEQFEWTDAESEYQIALKLSPNDAAAHMAFARWLLTQGRTEEAQNWARRARQLDPLSIGTAEMGWILFQSRHFEEAIAELRAELAVHPDNPAVEWFLGFALCGNGENQAAIPVLERALALSGGSPAVMGVLIRANARSGHRAEALRLLQQLKQRQQRGYVPAAAFVNAYLGLGDRENALAWCERAYQEKSDILQWIKVHPFFDSVRDDPRFIDLIRKIGLN
jgi:TolB-like protein/tetratricopeptide (TPR) repeat protein